MRAHIKTLRKTSLVSLLTFSLLSLNGQATNLVVNGDFTDNTNWVGLDAGGWQYHANSVPYGLISGALNNWAGPTNLTQDVTIANTGNYQFQWDYVAVQFGPYTGTTYGVSIGSSFSRDLIAPVTADDMPPHLDLSAIVTTPNSYQVRLSQGVHRIIFGDDSDATTNSTFFIIDNVSLVYIGPSGPTADDTQASLNTQAHRLRSTFNSTMASSNFANMNTYDCNLFDKNNMCISAGGRYTNIDNPSSNNSAAVVTLGYKVNSNIRIGGFLDQSMNNNTPTGIQVSNKNPMMGAFAVWNKNADGLGYQVKIANAYQDKDVTSTRDAFGETGEAGTGKTNLNTQSYVGELSYAFQYQDSTIVRPYFALRYTNIKQDAYTETGVSTPLSYAKLGDRSTTALMGVKLNHALTPRTNLTASLGIEQDINHKTDQLTASGVADLTQ
jgi:hypothetical protein